MKDQYFQGDVMFTRVAKAPKAAQPVEMPGDRIVLALGEATGHHHSLPKARGVALLEAPERTKEDELLNVRFLQIMEGATATITHQEHGPITLTPGTWRVSQQREYTEKVIVRVSD